MGNLESSPSLPVSPPEAEYHDKADALAAFVALSAADTERLRGYARFKMAPVRGRLHDADAQDLFQEALVKTLDGTRRWRRGVPFFQHMIACMSSIAHNWFEQARRYKDVEGFEGSVADADPSADPESRFDDQEKIDRLQRELGADVIALSVMQTLMDERTPIEAQKLLRLDNDVYWAARKRISRRARLVLGGQL